MLTSILDDPSLLREVLRVVAVASSVLCCVGLRDELKESAEGRLNTETDGSRLL